MGNKRVIDILSEIRSIAIYFEPNQDFGDDQVKKWFSKIADLSLEGRKLAEKKPLWKRALRIS